MVAQHVRFSHRIEVPTVHILILEMPLSVLLVLTSTSTLHDHETGFWVDEAATPYYMFRGAGFQVTSPIPNIAIAIPIIAIAIKVDIASIQGGVAPFDKTSISEQMHTENSRRFMEDKEVQYLVNNTKTIANVNPDDYDCVFSVSVDVSAAQYGHLPPPPSPSPPPIDSHTHTHTHAHLLVPNQ